GADVCFSGLRLGPVFGAVVLVAVAVVGREHGLRATGGAPHFARHFTLLNGVVSIVLGATGIVAVAMRHG
ncbi:MAG: hypothetical protein ACKPBA_02560, partial [Planctomycetota bacterium]